MKNGVGDAVKSLTAAAIGAAGGAGIYGAIGDVGIAATGTAVGVTLAGC